MNKTLLKELNIDTLDISRMAIQKFQNLEKAALLSLYLEKHKNFLCQWSFVHAERVVGRTE